MTGEKTDLLEAGKIVMPGKTRSESEKIRLARLIDECHDISQSLRSAGRSVEGLGAIEFQPCNPWTRAISSLITFQSFRGLHLAIILYELADMVTYRSEEEQP